LFCLPDAWAWLAPAAAVEYLEAAHPLASNYGLGMAIAQLDLTNQQRQACGELSSPFAPRSVALGMGTDNRTARSERLSARD